MRRDALRRYPALGFLAVAAALALLLPSRLSTPRSEPASLAEFAPVPGESEGSSELSELGSATGGGPAGRGAASGAKDARVPEGRGGPGQKRLNLKRCVGSPPRQTEDRLSPPCVPYFEGDNLGVTARGVTREEITVLFYYDAGSVGGTSRGGGVAETLPANAWFDLNDAAADEEPTFVSLLRAYRRYFNERFQIYGRTARFIVHFGERTAAQNTPATRKAEAETHIQRASPFAVVSMINTHADAYVDAMTRAGGVVFLGNPAGGVRGSAFQRASFYTATPGLLWSYIPSVEKRAQVFGRFLCAQIIGRPVSFSGNPLDDGEPRRLGLLYTTEENRPDLVASAELVREEIERCGGSFASDAPIPNHNCTQCGATNGPQVMAKFRQDEVTTIVMTGGYEGGDTGAAGSTGYRPEWVVAGDSFVEQNQVGRLQDQSVWRHARAVTTFTAVPDVEAQVCFTSARESDQSLSGMDIQNWGCTLYPDLRQLFTGIQVAGPRLTVRTLDQGFRSIPAIASTDPSVPACFYEPGDHTCVKDAQVQWWDPSGTASGASSPGCWRMVEGGERYLADRWPQRDVEAARTDTDPCNAQGLENETRTR